MSEHRPVVSSAKLIAGCTLTSRVTGLVRDMLLAHTFGVAWVADALNYAFQFPNLFRRLFGEGALAAVFVPTFTDTLETNGRPAAWRLFARTLALLTVTILGVILLIEAIILAIWLASPANEARELALSLTALMLPFMLTICVVALFGSILNCVGSFVPAALTPVVLNICVIIGVLWVGPALGGADPEKQVFGVAISVLAAGILQLLALLPALKANGVVLGWSTAWRDARVRGMLGKVPPVLFGQGILLIGTFLDAQICLLLARAEGGAPVANWGLFSFEYPLAEGALSAITYAQRLYQFPLGVLGISLAVAALPMFSRLATRRDWDAWSDEVRQTLRVAAFVGLLAGSLTIVLAEPIVRLLFEYRKFDALATIRTARVLTVYGLGMWAFFLQHIVLRAFYSVGDVRTPVKISAVLVPVNLAMSIALVWIDAVREVAFAISTVTTSTAAFAAGVWLLQRRTRVVLLDRAIVWAAARMLAAAVAAAAAVFLLRAWWTEPLHETVTIALARRALDAFGGLAAGVGLYLGLAFLLRLPEARLVSTLRFRRRREAGP